MCVTHNLVTTSLGVFKSTATWHATSELGRRQDMRSLPRGRRFAPIRKIILASGHNIVRNHKIVRLRILTSILLATSMLVLNA